MPTVQRRVKAPVRRMTTQDYLSGSPDEFKSELIYGELVVSPSPTDEHQGLQLDLGSLLRRWTRAHDLGQVWHDLDMVLDEFKDLVYRPDLLFLAKEHQGRRKKGRVLGPADLCVEILSPSDKPHIQRRKFSDYERYGVGWYWVVDPEAATLEENQLSDGVFVCH